MIPPGIDLSAIAPAPPSDRDAAARRPRAVEPPPQGHRARDRRLRELDVDLEIVEGLHHDEALERYARADIVVDQLNAGWYGVFAIEAMALGKPVVTYLHDEAVARTEEAFGVARADRARDEGDARATRCARSSRTPARAAASRRREPRVRRAACTTSSASPTACSTSTLASRCVAGA